MSEALIGFTAFKGLRERCRECCHCGSIADVADDHFQRSGQLRGTLIPHALALSVAIVARIVAVILTTALGQKLTLLRARFGSLTRGGAAGDAAVHVAPIAAPAHKKLHAAAHAMRSAINDAV